MTAQAHDRLVYQDDEYDIIGVKGVGLLTPEKFGLKPLSWSTACYRGYISTHACVDRELFLIAFHIGWIDENSEWKPIQGIMPEIVYVSGSRYSTSDSTWREDTWEDGKKYSGLKVETYFTGGILAASSFIDDLYVHMGFGKPYQYEQVIELLFHEGSLTKMIDHSAKAAEWREQILRQQEDEERRIEELRQSGLSNKEIMDLLYSERQADDQIAKGIEWRFSMDYDEWF